MSTPVGPGLALCERFHGQVVAPLVAELAPGLRYDAALVGAGSEVLGFDDPVSTDHDWAPRVKLVVHEDTQGDARESLRLGLDERLPDHFEGFPVRIDAADPGAGEDRPGERTRVGGHRVIVTTAADLAAAILGRDPREGLRVEDWLSMPQQRLAEMTGGAVFRDDGCGLAAVRIAVAWYPDDVWRYLLGSQWQRIAQLEPFVGRTGDVGDDLGSRLLAASLVRDAMRLAFLIERRYAPYGKWFGTAFARLGLAPRLAPDLDSAVAARDWRDREAAIVRANLTLVKATNALGLGAPVDAVDRSFYDRPYRVVAAERVRDAIGAAITDGDVRSLIDRIGWVGAVDQLSDSVDLLTRPDRLARLSRVYSGDGMDA